MGSETIGLRHVMVGVVLALALVSESPPAEAGGWRPLGPEGGEVLTFAVSPHPNEVIYAGTSSGVFRSDDGAKSWRFCGLAGERVLALAVDPTTATRVYAGVDDVRPGVGGVFVTTDGGDTWSEARNGLEYPRYPPTSPHFRYLPVTSLLVDKHDPDTVWAGTGENDGLFKSTDRGTTWSWAHFDDDVETLAADPTAAGIIFVSLHGLGLYRSLDSGNTWSLIGAEILRQAPNGVPYHPTVFDMAISPADPDVVYAATLEELFKSSDGGDHWQSLGELPSSVLNAAYAVGIAADPYDPDSAYVATWLDGVFRTRDGGASWEQIGEGLECGPDGWGVAHTRAAALAVAPSASRLILGTEREGVFVRPLAEESWIRSNQGPLATDVTSIAVNPRNPRELLAAARGLGVLRSNDGGKSWAPANTGIGDECGPPNFIPWWTPPPDCRVLHKIVWPGDGGTVLAAGECGVFMSQDLGRSWDLSGSPGSWVGTLAVAPRDPRQVYALQDRWIVKRSLDGGVTWSSCANVPFENGLAVSLAVSPEDASVIYAGTNRGLFVSSDGCATWDGPAPDINAECPEGQWTVVSAIGFAPDSPGFVYAGTSCGLFVSGNGGEDWLRTGLDGLDINALAFGRGEIFAGTWGDGIWASGDGGATWARISDDEHNPYINELLVDPTMRRLYSSSAGNGVAVLDRWLPEPRRPGRRVPTATAHGKSLSVRGQTDLMTDPRGTHGTSEPNR